MFKFHERIPFYTTYCTFIVDWTFVFIFPSGRYLFFHIKVWKPGNLHLTTGAICRVEEGDISPYIQRLLQLPLQQLFWYLCHRQSIAIVPEKSYSVNLPTWWSHGQTVDGRNSAPVNVVNVPVFIGSEGFIHQQVVQDFFRQLYLVLSDFTKLDQDM